MITKYHRNEISGIPLLLTIIVAVIILLIGANDIEAGYKCFLSGNDYNAMAKESRVTYIAGVVDGIRGANISLKNNSILLSDISNYTDKMTATQIEAIIDKYMKDNPEEWHQAMSLLVVKALGEAFLKSRKPK